MTKQTSKDTDEIPVIGWRLLENGDAMVSIKTKDSDQKEGYFTPDQAHLLSQHLASGARRAKSVKAVNAWISRHLPGITSEQRIAMIEDLMKTTDKDDLQNALAPLLGFRANFS